MAGGVLMALGIVFICYLAFDKVDKTSSDYFYSFFVELGMILIGVICYYGGEFIDHLKKIEQSLEYMEKNMDNIRKETDLHLESIEDSLKSIEHDDDI